MDKEHILPTLRQHVPELKAAGMAHLRLFGSVARGEAEPGSDIDLLVDFDPSAPVTLVTLGGLESRLSELLGVTVDLSSQRWLREPVRERALKEAVVAF